MFSQMCKPLLSTLHEVLPGRLGHTVGILRSRELEEVAELRVRGLPFLRTTPSIKDSTQGQPVGTLRGDIYTTRAHLSL